MNPVKLDVEALTKAIMLCFDNSMDNRFTIDQQTRFLIRGKILRGHLINLVAAQWDLTAKPAVTKANADLVAVNNELVAVQTDLTKVASVVGKLAILAGDLETVLGMTAKFV